MQQKGFASLILVVLVIAGIALGIYLVQHPTFFKPHASENTPAASGAAAIPTLAFVFFGESNIGGLASNDDATAAEKASTSSVQILNNSYLLDDPPLAKFENLHIGFNNRLDHDGLLGTADNHGLELQLANSVKAHAFPNNPQVYLVKSGQGGSVVGMWLDTVNFPFWNKFLQRISAAKSLLPAKPVQWVVWYSLGINDHLGNPPGGIPRTSVNVFKSKTIDIIHNIKTQLPGAIIVMTQFQAQSTITISGFDTNFADYNAAMAEIAASESNVYVVDTTGSALLPANTNAGMHWDYAGFKTIGSRMVDITNNALQTVNTLSATPNPCILNTSQTCTSKISWNFPGITDLKITVRENPGSVVSYQLASSSVDIPWITANGATFEAYSGNTLLRSLFVSGVSSTQTPSPSASPTPSPSVAPSPSISPNPSPSHYPGTAISAAPNPCVLNGETCESKISWDYSVAPDVKIRIKEVPGSLFASGVKGSQSAPWIRASGATFQLYAYGEIRDEVFVSGVAKNTITASPNPCPLNGANTCTAKITWNFPDYPDLKISIKEAPGSLFAQAPYGSIDAPWIAESGATFEAYSGKSKVGSLFVKGTGSAPASPTPSASSVEKIGDFDNDGDVDIFDYNLFIGDYVSKNLRSDFDNNGKVDLFDFNLLIQNFGK